MEQYLLRDPGRQEWELSEQAQQIGDWRLIREIGRGAMGVVYLAERTDGWEQVAIKVMHPETAGNPAMVARFFAEARAISRVLHPNVVKLEDYGQAEDVGCYLVMELLDGESLTSLMKRVGQLSTARAIDLGAQIAEGLAAAHDGGVIHRDLKPDNIMIVQRDGKDRVKVLDFGLAKITGEGTANLSHAGGILGTPHYMAPEAARGSKSIDHRVDIYALGCILYELVTGSVLFPAAAFGEALVRHVYDAPTPPSQLNPNVPPELENVILRALSKDPRHRFVSMTEMAWALRRPGGAAAQASLPSDYMIALADPLASQPLVAEAAEPEVNAEAAPLPPINVELLSVPIELDFTPPVARAAPLEEPMPEPIGEPAMPLDSLPALPTLFDPMPPIETLLAPTPVQPEPPFRRRGPDSVRSISGEVTVITPPRGMAPTSDFGMDAPTEVASNFFGADAEITDRKPAAPSPFDHARFVADANEQTVLRALPLSASPAPSPKRPPPATRWDEVEPTDYVPPLVAIQLLEQQQKAMRTRRIRRVIASAMTTMVVIGIALLVSLRAMHGAAPVAAEVTVNLESEPSGAEVFAGTQQLGRTPITLRRPRAEQLTLRLEKPGHHATDAFVSLTDDQRITVKLKRLPERQEASAIPHVDPPSRARKSKHPAPRVPEESKITGDELIQLQF